MLPRPSVCFALVFLFVCSVARCGAVSLDCSPKLDGRITFIHFPSDLYAELDLVNANGTDCQTLAPTQQLWEMQMIDTPAYSPDGSFIVFSAATPEQWAEIIRIQADGSAMKVLLRENLNTADVVDAFPAVSPDGKQVVFESSRSGKYAIYTMSAIDGSDLKQLTSNPTDDAQPTFAPDGHIVFVSNRDGHKEIYSMDADGSHQKRLTWGTGEYDHPAVSPRGDCIAFTDDIINGPYGIDGYNENGPYDIYTMYLDGIITIRFASGGSHPTFSPDGRWIAYSTSTGIVAKSILGLDEKPVQITEVGTNTLDLSPSWGP